MRGKITKEINMLAAALIDNVEYLLALEPHELRWSVTALASAVEYDFIDHCTNVADLFAQLMHARNTV